MSAVETRSRSFMLWPDGRVEEIDGEGETWDYDREPSLYADLVLAGYPLANDTHWSDILDLSVDPDDPADVIAHVCGPHRGDYSMGALSALFLAWYVRNA